MARAATTTDVFTAVAEARRRQILDLLAQGERPVGDLVAAMDLAQPLVSKHLKVLVEAGYVSLDKPSGSGRVRTWARLTPSGRAAFSGHVAELRRLAAFAELPG